MTKFKRIQTVAGSDGQQIFSKYAGKLRRARRSGQTVSAKDADRTHSNMSPDLLEDTESRKASPEDSKKDTSDKNTGPAPLRCHAVIKLVSELDHDLQCLRETFPSYEHAENSNSGHQTALPEAQAIELTRQIAEVLAENFIRLNGMLKRFDDMNEKTTVSSAEKKTALELEPPDPLQLPCAPSNRPKVDAEVSSGDRGSETEGKLDTEDSGLGCRFSQYTMGSVYTMLGTTHGRAAQDEKRRNSEILPWLGDDGKDDPPPSVTSSTKEPLDETRENSDKTRTGGGPQFQYTNPITNEVDPVKVARAVDEDFLRLGHRHALGQSEKREESSSEVATVSDHSRGGGESLPVREGAKEGAGLWRWVQRAFGGGGHSRNQSGQLGEKAQVV